MEKKSTVKTKKIKAESLFMKLPFVFFIAILAVIYISNTYTSEKCLRKSQALNKEVNELKSNYLSIHQQTVYGSTQSELKKKLKSEGFKESRSIPEKIDITEG